MEQGQPIAILAVDDEPGVLALVRRCPSDEERVTLIEASRAKEALELIAKRPALDLLITLKGTAMADDDKNRHDFTNQPGIILGLSDMLLADAADDDPRRRDLEEIDKTAQAARDLLACVFPVDADTPQSRLTPPTSWSSSTRPARSRRSNAARAERR